MTRFIWRAADGRADASQVGGKAANLHRLIQLGLRVPEFFVVTTAAYEASRATTDSGHVPAEVDDSIRAALATDFPADTFVAVRSSAVGEDATGESFAGIHESFLYVRGVDAILAAVRKVWASGSSERARAYRESRGLPLHDVIAVVVQRMVDPVTSGVAFTAEPTTGDVQRVVISALWGLGEGLVSRGLDADTYVVDKIGDGAAANPARTVAAKSEQVIFDRAANGGVAQVPLAQEQRNAPSLSDTQVREVALAARRIENAYGTPQDIEFVFDASGTLWTLQTRPITTLSEDGPAAGNGLLWDNSNIVESFSGVTSPMTFSVIRRAYATVYRCVCEVMGVPAADIRRSQPIYDNMLGLIRGRVYYNLRSWYRLLRLFPGFAYNRGFMESMMGVKQSWEPEPEPTAARRYLVAMPALARLAARSAWNFWRIRALADDFEQRFERHYQRWAAMDFHTMKPHELAEVWREMQRDVLEQWRAPIINDLFVMVNYGILKKLCVTWCDDASGSLQNDLICGEGGIRSTEPTFRLMELARHARANPALRTVFADTPAERLRDTIRADERFADFRAEFDDYLEAYGFRCMNELKLEEPTLRDRPDFAFQVMKNYLLAPTEPDPAAMVAREREIRKRAETRARRALRSPVKRVVFRRVLRNARLGVKNRENMRFARTRIFGLVRELVRALGANLVRARVLDLPDDVFLLTLDEVFDFVNGTAVSTRLGELAALRRREFEEFRGDDAAAPDDRFETFGMVYHRNRLKSAVARAVDSGDGLLRGIPCSPGRVTGAVKVILTPSDDARLNGEILVAGRTDPGWVPLYPSVSGLLIERGSILSHSAIVAREMGIPTIVGVPELTRLLRTGQVVTMDGTTGSIEVQES